MAKKDKFKSLQQGGGSLSSFQDMVQQAATVAAIEKQADQSPIRQETQEGGGQRPSAPADPPVTNPAGEQRFMRLPNPQIPIAEYNLVTRYTERFPNMTRQDFVELAIIEKLWQEKIMTDDDFERRKAEICARPPRGHRKGTKTQISK